MLEEQGPAVGVSDGVCSHEGDQWTEWSRQPLISKPLIPSHFVNKAVHTYRSSAGYTFPERVILMCCRSGFAYDSRVFSAEAATPVNVRGKQLLFAYCGSRPKAKEAAFVPFSTKADL